MLAESANASVDGFRRRAVSLGHKLFPKPVVDRGSQCTHYTVTLKPMALNRDGYFFMQHSFTFGEFLLQNRNIFATFPVFFLFSQ
jgi:hypothetical protein